jgi:CcmD family protein
MSEWNYIVASYAATWIVIVGYAVYLRLRQRDAVRQLERP